MKYPLEIIDGLPIITSENEVLLISTTIDSIQSYEDSLAFMGKLYDCEKSPEELNRINQYLANPITGLLGKDILKKYNLMIDYRQGFMEFATDEIIKL